VDYRLGNISFPVFALAHNNVPPALNRFLCININLNFTASAFNCLFNFDFKATFMKNISDLLL